MPCRSNTFQRAKRDQPIASANVEDGIARLYTRMLQHAVTHPAQHPPPHLLVPGLVAATAALE
jgi:hypothetical protein